MIFHVRGIVDFRDEERGYRVCIDSRDAKARDAIVRFVQGNADTDVNRRARRFQVQLAVEWADGGDMITGETVDLSSTGTSIHSETLPAKGSIVTIRFLDQNVRFHGDVVWLASDPEPRFGVMFVIGEDEKRAALQGLIGKVLETRAASM